MTVSGFLNIHKPVGMTSHDVVAKVRRLVKPQGVTKVGHAGTLDPLATGVLILCVGSATRLSDDVMHGTKQYHATVRLGINTDTYDAEGSITEQHDTSHLTPEQIQQALRQFVGEIDQIPPMYSAIKWGGKKLYDLARAGQTVERPPRRITIHALEMLEYSLPDVTIQVTCSAGTYIRSLAYDLGRVLGVGGYLTALSRTQSGGFKLEDAVLLDALTPENWQQFLISPRAAFADCASLDLMPQQIEAIRHGRAIPIENDTLPERVMAYAPDGQLVAILRSEANHWQPEKVFV